MPASVIIRLGLLLIKTLVMRRMPWPVAGYKLVLGLENAACSAVLVRGKALTRTQRTVMATTRFTWQELEEAIPVPSAPGSCAAFTPLTLQTKSAILLRSYSSEADLGIPAASLNAIVIGSATSGVVKPLHAQCRHSRSRCTTSLASSVQMICPPKDRNAPLGAGGFGTVYRGCLHGGTQVAIKVLAADSQQGQAEFDRELRVLGSLHHRHLLPLLGSCPERRALVYDFMEGGSLQDRLQLLAQAPAGPAGAAPANGAAAAAAPLPWCERVRICHEVVLGLMWLHNQRPPVLHMDLKSANICLTVSSFDAVLVTVRGHNGVYHRAMAMDTIRFAGRMPAMMRQRNPLMGTFQLGDIGFARDLNGDGNNGHISYMQSSVLRGTPGYMAPEYMQEGARGTFTDVYALGVVMCELLTGKPAREAVRAVEEFAEDTRYASEAEGTAALQPLLDRSAAWHAAAAASTLTDPVSTPAGHTFCRACIAQWLSSRSTCPVTRQPLAVQQLVPSYAMAGLLERMVILLQQQQQQQLAGLSAPSAAQPRATAGPAAAPTQAVVRPDPRWRDLLQAAKARPDDADAWQALGRCFQGCTEIDLSTEACGGIKIDVAGATALAQHAAQHWRNLQSLDLSYNDIGAAGAIALAQHAAQHWPNLQSLHMGYNDIGAAGATALAQHAAQHWPNLQILDLRRNNIDVAGATALAQHAAQHWRNLQSLDLRRNNIDVAGATALAQHAAQHWPNLQRLYLGGNNIYAAGATALAQHAAQHWRNLQILHMGGNKIGAAGATALAQHAAQHWPNLQRLYLGGNNIYAAGATALAQHAAQHWPNLQSLSLRYNSIGDAGATTLTQHAAQHWPNLQSLDLEDNHIDVASATALAQHAAQHWPNLQSLDLRGNSICAAGATALAQHAAQHWPNLQSLDLSQNCIGAAGTTALAQHAAQHWPNLQSLDLGHNNIGVAGATALAQHAAQHWPNLQSLNLGHNNIGVAGATALAQHAAQHWRNLQSLDLSCNRIGAASATALAQHAAQHWPNLQSLDLSFNDIGAAGATALAQHAAQHWPNLQSLDLRCNSIADGGTTALAQHAAQHWPNLNLRTT
ncbi:hypothetical protein COO60DRAFT_1459743 [Scenedesmus sp. NREL 46B-D3]|nr:hypothetical protein COO60DRAFT_1459743 [Scenedesmus sp. NREL 46B-D3]